MAAKFLKVKLPSDGDKIWWQDFDVTPRQLEGWFLFVKYEMFPVALCCLFVLQMVWHALIELLP